MSSLKEEKIPCQRYNNLTYSIEDIDFTQNPTKSFETKEGNGTYLEYYKKIQENNPGQPEEIQPQENIQENNPGQPEEIQPKEIQPQENKQEDNPTYIKFLNDEEMYILIQGNKPDQPEESQDKENIQAGTNPDQPEESQAQENYQSMLSSHNLSDWILICTKMDLPKARDFVQNLQRVGPPMGMRVNEPRYATIEQDRINLYIQAFKENYRDSTSIVVFVEPNNKKDRYDAIKKQICIDNAVPSQVIVAQTLSKKTNVDVSCNKNWNSNEYQIGWRAMGSRNSFQVSCHDYWL